MKLTFSKKILILATIIFVITLILDIIFTNLLLGKITNINDKIRQLDISSQERENELNLKDSIASSIVEREKLAEYFVGVGNAETVEFTKYLEYLAGVSGVTQRKSLTYEAVAGLSSSDIVSVIRYRFNVSGKWNNVLSFLQATESLSKASLINNVTLSFSPESKTWSADLDFSVVKLK